MRHRVSVSPQTAQVILFFMRSKTFYGANILKAGILDTGSMGGDAGHGCHVTLRLHDLASTNMEFVDISYLVTRVVGNKTYLQTEKCIEMHFRGDSERKTLIEALEFFLDELKSKP